jgi:hypothetical protein
VQALGQCIFLLMLIIGGVAVPLSSLPDWAQRVSAFFPGRYAVETLSACVMGDGLSVARFSALALILIGAAGCFAGARMFRWDAQQRFATTSNKGWVFVALAAWIAVGVTAESRGHVTRTRTTATNQAATPAATAPSTAPPLAAPQPQPSPPPAPVPTPKPAEPVVKTEPPPKPTPVPTLAPSTAPPASGNGTPATTPAPATSPAPTTTPAPAPPGTAPAAAAPATWRAVTMADIDRDLIFTRLPPDSGIVTPIARAEDLADQDAALQLEQIRLALPKWKPGKVEDPVQRVRNFLFVPAVVDVYQMEGLEQFLPQVVFERLQEDVPKDDLIKILYWIALHPFDGDDSAVDDLRSLGLGNGPNDMQTTRDRVAVYAVKLLGRLTGKITPQ